MATQLKNVKFGQAVLCSISTTDLNVFNLTDATLCGGTICGSTINDCTIDVGSINSIIYNRGYICGGTISEANIQFGTIIGSIISGGSVTTDSFGFASCGGTFCGNGGTITDVRISGGTISGGSVTTDSFGFASCGGRFFGNGGTIDLGSGYLENAIISSTTLYSPNVSGGTFSGVTLCGTINNSGTISGGNIEYATLSGGVLSGWIDASLATVYSGTFESTNMNSPTLNSPTINEPSICGYSMLDGFLSLTGSGVIAGGVISGSRLSYVSFTCGETISGNYATLSGINISGEGSINAGPVTASSFSLASGGYFDCNGGDINNISDVYGAPTIHGGVIDCDTCGQGFVFIFNGTRYAPKTSGNQIIFEHS